MTQMNMNNLSSEQSRMLHKNWAIMRKVWDGIDSQFPDQHAATWAILEEWFEHHVPGFIPDLLGARHEYEIDDQTRNAIVEMLYLVNLAVKDGFTEMFVFDYIIRKSLAAKTDWSKETGNTEFKPVPTRRFVDLGYIHIDMLAGQSTEEVRRWLVPYFEKYRPEALPLFTENKHPRSNGEYWQKWSYMMGCYFLAVMRKKGKIINKMDADEPIRAYFKFPHPKADNLRVLPGGGR